MAEIRATIPQPMAQAIAAVRKAAADQGYALAEGESGPDRLMLRKGTSAFSWGSSLRVTFTPDAPERRGTSVVIVTGETFAFTDWGRGKRAVRKLVAAAGGTENSQGR